MSTDGCFWDPNRRTASVSWASQIPVVLGIIENKIPVSIEIRRPEPLALAGGFCFLLNSMIRASEQRYGRILQPLLYALKRASICRKLLIQSGHMDTTQFFAQIWGPVLIAVGLGFFVSHSYYIKMYRDLEGAPFAVLIFGMFAMAAGVGHVLMHNIWDTSLEMIVSALGWGLLIKGFICVVAPSFIEKAGGLVLVRKSLSAIGGALIILGAYLTWMSYFV